MRIGFVFAIGVFLFLISAAGGQAYLMENTTWQENLTGSQYFNAIAFGDIDNDADLDLIQIGCSTGSLLSCSTADKTRVYVNNGTSLVENETWQQNLTAVGDGSIAFGDIDNDGDLDLVLAGGKIFIRVYTNNGTSFIENSSWQQEPLAQQSSTNSVTLGDIDNDGDLDLVMVDTGFGNSTFLNNGTAFIGNTIWGQDVLYDFRVSSALVDIDNDGDLDSISTGYDYGSIYINNGTALELSSIWGTLSMDHVSIAIGDLDNDGDMDLIEIAETNPLSYVLINNGNLLYINDTWNTIYGCFYGSLSLGDYNNDGSLDLILTGNRGGSKNSIIYDNNGTTFLRNYTEEANLTDTQSDSAVWADIDNDNNLDLIIMGVQKVYINNITSSNTAPTPPTSFSSAYSNREISLGWSNGSDAETTSNGLYYNLMIGNSTANHTIISGIYGGQGDASGGGGIAFGYFGNMMQRKNFTLKVDRLQPSTTYYWYVQTIDTGLKAGNWSAIQSFNTPADMERPSVTVNAPNDSYSSWNFTVVFNVTVSDNLNVSNVSLWGNWSGGWHLNETNSSGLNDTNYIFTKNLSASGNGTYVWSVQACDNASNCYWTGNRTFILFYPSIGLNENATWQWNLTASNYHNGAVLGDIDNDGDLDLISIGCDSGESICTVADKSYVFINNGTSFIEDLTWEQNLSKEGDGSIALGDYDNDGDLDLILTGGWVSVTRIYTNNGTTFVENSTWQNVVINEPTSASSSSVAFGDIDNDGDLDLIFSDMGIPSRIVYLNNGTSFVNDSTWGQEITGEDKVSTGLIDFDNDGDLDLNIMGDGSGKSYINNGTSFVYTVDWVTLWSDEGNMVWGDFDNDGDFDYALSGGANFRVGINNGSTWTNGPSWESGVSSLSWGSMMFGDYDNNGYLDLVNAGMLAGDQIQISSNNGTAFERDVTAEANLTGIRKGSALWGDVDNDGDLDLVVIKSQKVYINNITTPNTPPTPPTSFSSSYQNREIKLGWGNGSDAETSSNGLYYNLMIGDSTANHTIISGIYGGSGDATRGGTAFGYFGNMMQRKNFTLKVDRLSTSTTYYWYVQTIDTGLKAGNWSAVQSFNTPADMSKPSVTVNSPQDGYSSDNFTVVFNVSVSDNLNVSNVSLFGNWSGWHLNETNSSGLNDTDYIFTKNLSSFGDGSYMWEIVACDNETNCRSTGNYTLIVDTTKPEVGFADPTPADNANLSVTSVTINISHNESNPGTLILNWNGTNTSYAYSGNYSVIVNSSVINGTLTYYVWVNDTAGNQNQTGTRTLTIDTVPISNVDFVSPTPGNGSSRGYNYTYINVSLSEEAHTCMLEWNNGTAANITMTKQGTTCYRNMTNLISYVYSYRVYANDSANNWNNSEFRMVTVDMGTPIVMLVSPGHDSFDSDGGVTFVYNASDTALDSCSLWGNWSGGWHLNETNSSPNNGTYSNFTKVLNDGSYVWNVICNDTAANEGYSPSNLTINIDMTYPVVAIFLPQNITYNSSPALNFSYSEGNPDSCLYDLNGAGNVTLASCDTNGTVMTSSEGSNNVVLYMNDSAGNLNSSSMVYWTLDTTPPRITIDSPANQSYKEPWVWANLTLDENTSWCGYSLNGSGNVSMSNDSAAHFYYNVSGLAEAGHNISFSCNDSVGNVNTTAVLYFTIDMTAPVISNVSNGTAYWNRINISWNTDELSNSTVLYGTNASSLSLNRTNTSLATSHNINLTGLSGSTTYYYNVSSCDSAGNCNTTGVYNFTTPLCTESWAYTAWSACAGGTQTRTASDVNDCGTAVNRSVLSRTCVSGSSSGNGVTQPPSATYTWDKIEPGETAVMDIGKEDVSFTRIDFQVNNKVNDVNIAVTRLGSKPADVQDAAGEVYQYINISHTANLNQTSLRSVTIGFRVNRSWVAGNRINKSTVRLNRHVSGNWVGLSTQLVNETLNHINYESDSPGFSYFAVTGEAVNVSVPVCNNNSVCEPGLGENASNCPADCNVTGQVCVPGTRQCSGSLLQECNPGGTGWAAVQDCTYGCGNGQCLEKPVGADYTFIIIMAAAVVISVLFYHRKRIRGLI